MMAEPIGAGICTLAVVAAVPIADRLAAASRARRRARARARSRGHQHWPNPPR